MDYTRKVFYYETDQMGIVHHSNFIRWFEEARIGYLSSIGYSYNEIEQLGLISPVLSVNCEYISMVRFGDTVNVNIKLTSFKYVKFTFDYVVTDVKTKDVRAKGSTSHCFLNKQGRPANLKKDYPQIYDIMMQAASDKE